MTLHITPPLRLLLLMWLFFLGISSCKKYEDGPWLSLRSKPARIDGNWVVGGALTSDGFDLGPTFEGYVFDFSRNGDAAVTFPLGFDTIVLNGKWDLTFNKSVFQWQLQGDTTAFYYNGTEEFDILRLTGNSFWLIDKDNSEIRLRPQ